MNARDAMLDIVDDSHIGIRELQRRVGDLGRVLYRGSTPTTETLARVANECGYDLLLRRRYDGREIPIDPD